MASDTDPSTTAPPHRRKEVFRAVRGARLSGSRDRSGHRVTHYPGEAAEAPEVFAKRPYSEPND